MSHFIASHLHENCTGEFSYCEFILDHGMIENDKPSLIYELRAPTCPTHSPKIPDESENIREKKRNISRMRLSEPKWS